MSDQQNAHISQQVGEYYLIRKLGGGGFGTVYLAEHVHEHVQAAVKVLHVPLTKPEDFKDFINEARTVRLRHPHIVSLLDFGVSRDDLPFLVMEYAPKGTLRDSHPKGDRVSLPTIVSYIGQLAPALQYAHDQRIIHRDIKPENILVRADGTLVVSDFGIAKLLEQSVLLSVQTQVGTPVYMAPEQYRGYPCFASDQYALAVVIYEWISGVRPFDGPAVGLAVQHMNTPPPSLLGRLPTLPQAVEHVIFKALAKAPEDRFEGIQEFADALCKAIQPSLDTMVLSPPIETSNTIPLISPEPVSRPDSGSKPATDIPVSQKRSVLTRHSFSRRAVVTGLVGLTVTGIVGSSLAWLLRSRFVAPPVPGGSQLHTITPTLTPTPTRVPVGTTFYTYRGHFDSIRVLAWSPDGKRIASGSDDTTAQVWDAATGSNAFIYRGHTGHVEGVAWSPDSKRIASGSADTTVQIWDSSTGNLIYTYHGHSLWVNRVSWSPNGKYIVSGEQSGTVGRVVEVRVWEVDTGTTLFVYRGHTNGVFTVAWSPDGTRIASDGYDETVQVWEPTSGKLISTYKDNNFHLGLSWSPDGKYIAVGGSDSTARVLDANTGDVVYNYNSRANSEGDAAWSPEGKHIAVGCDDHTVQIWETNTGSIVFTYQGHTDWLGALAWSPDSKRVVSGSHDTTVRVWQAM